MVINVNTPSYTGREERNRPHTTPEEHRPLASLRYPEGAPSVSRRSGVEEAEAGTAPGASTRTAAGAPLRPTDANGAHFGSSRNTSTHPPPPGVDGSPSPGFSPPPPREPPGLAPRSLPLPAPAAQVKGEGGGLLPKERSRLLAYLPSIAMIFQVGRTKWNARRRRTDRQRLGERGG